VHGSHQQAVERFFRDVPAIYDLLENLPGLIVFTFQFSFNRVGKTRISVDRRAGDGAGHGTAQVP